MSIGERDRIGRRMPERKTPVRDTGGTRRRASVALVAAATMLASVVAGCGAGEPDTGPGAAAAEAGRVQEEHPEETEEAPDSDEQSEEGHAGEVHLSADQLRELDVEIEAVEGGSARSVVRRPATLRLDPDRTAFVGPRLESKVVRVVADLGDRIAEGDTLAVLSSVTLGEAKSNFLTARARLRTAEAEYRREEDLFEKEISSEAELLEAEARFVEARAERDAAREALRLYGLAEEEIDAVEPAADVPLSYFALRSPVAGMVQRRDLSPGQTVGPSETPIHVADLERVWVMIEAYDRDVSLLEIGRPVDLSVRSLPDRTFEGTIDWISYELDPETRTLQVRATVENHDGALRGGMYGTARMHLASDVRNALVPVDAIQTLQGRDVLFVPGGEPGAFRPVEVRLGAESEGGWVEILSGVQPGDSAVVSGAFDLMSAATAATRSAAHSH